MTKKILTIISVVLCLVLVFAFVGCSKDAFGPVTGGPNADDKVESNGGMVVQKGDYFYFINGVEEKSASNDFPNVKKGAIYRMKSDFTEPTVIVPKIVTADNANAGFYIYGDYIYYTSPSTEKDRTGTAKFNNIAFCRTKLDGTKTEVITTLTEFAVQFSFYEASDKTVYLAYYEDKTLSVVNTSTKKKVAKIENLTNKVIMDADGVYFTQMIFINKKGEEVEYNQEDAVTTNKADYNKIFKFNFETLEKEVYKSGATEKVTYDLNTYKDGVVYAYKNKAVEELKGLFAVKGGDTADIQMTANVYTDVIPLGIENGVIVKDSTSGKSIWIKAYGENDTIVKIAEGVNMYKVIGNDLYYFMNNKDRIALYKIDYTAENVEEINGTLLCDWDVNTSFYSPEIIGDNFFFMNNEHKERTDNEGEENEELIFERYEDYMYVANIADADVDSATLLGFQIDKDQPGYDAEEDEENKK